MTGLNLLPRQRFELVFSDGTIVPGKFGTTATALYCTKKGNLLLSEVSKKIVNIKNAGTDDAEYDLYLQDLLDYIICACQAAAMETNSKFSFNTAQLGAWADDYYFDTETPNVLITIFGHSFPKLEKKNQQEPASN